LAARPLQHDIALDPEDHSLGLGLLRCGSDGQARPGETAKPCDDASITMHDVILLIAAEGEIAYSSVSIR
jgi:hypothetical protein